MDVRRAPTGSEFDYNPATRYGTMLSLNTSSALSNHNSLCFDLEEHEAKKQFPCRSC
jgi:hypothetical protein